MTDFTIQETVSFLQKCASPPKRIVKRKNNIIKNSERISVYPKQIEFGISIRLYRYMNKLSQAELAEVCSIRGKSRGIMFAQTDISNYENFKHVPGEPKFQILMETMGITEADL